MSATPYQLSIVLPVYNEGPNIGGVLASISDQVRTPHEVIVVYDYDEDDTLPVVRSLQARMPELRLHRNAGRGVLAAMRSGFEAARAPYVLVAMADGSDDMAVVDRMIGMARDGADLVAASRYVWGGAQIGGPRLKGLLSRLAGWSLHVIGGLPIHDPTNNFKLYSRTLLRDIEIESSAGFELALELTVKAHIRGYRLGELPTVWRERRAGTSRFRIARWLPHYLRWYVMALRERTLWAKADRHSRNR